MSWGTDACLVQFPIFNVEIRRYNMRMKNKVTFVFEVVESNVTRFIPIKAWTVNEAISIMKINGWSSFKLV